MKAIPRNQLLVMIQNNWESEQSVFEDSLIQMLEQFGDEWYYSREEGKFEKCVDNGLYRAREFNV